jgi:hypothetical protein
MAEIPKQRVAFATWQKDWEQNASPRQIDSVHKPGQ